MGESIKSRFKPSFPKKYKGDSDNIICRSSWERRFCNYCDLNENVLQWGSEEFWIPYKSPVDKRVHRYFPDFYIKVKQSSGVTKKFIIEVKPKYQTKPPVKNPKRKTKKWYKDVQNWGINSAKWKSANQYCEDKGMEFKILTEDHLNPQYK